MRVRHNLLLTLLALGAAGSAASAATIPVTTTADTIANDGQCSLREAVLAARFDQAVQGCAPGASGEDVIQLEAAEYRLAAGGAGEDGNESGDLDTGPFNTLRIVGRGMNATVVGAAGDRVFDVFTGASLGLADLTVRDGIAPEGGSGGAVRSRGTLTALRVAFINNAAGKGHTPEDVGDDSGEGGGGGAIASEGQLQVSDSVFSANRAGDSSNAGQLSGPGGSSTFSGGFAGDGGAILVSAGSASLANVTVSGSRVGDGTRGLELPNATIGGGGGGDGGGIAVTGGSATIVNATFQGNRAGNTTAPLPGSPGNGGAASVKAPGALSITFSTFSGNASGSRAGAAPGVGASVLGASVGGSILADAGGACATLAPASLVNVVLPGDPSCPGAKIAGDPRLGALADNGGAVPTMLLGAGSPAIDAIVGVRCAATDARGQIRPRFAGCDAGAVEIQPGSAAAPGGGGPGGGGAAALRGLTALRVGPVAFRAAGRKPLGTTVTFQLATASKVVLTVQRAAAGRKSGGRCVAPSKRLRSAKRCVRKVTLPGNVTKQGIVGVNLIRFSGKLRGRALAPGPYTLVLTLPKAGAAAAVALAKGFRIIR